MRKKKEGKERKRKVKGKVERKMLKNIHKGWTLRQKRFVMR